MSINPQVAVKTTFSTEGFLLFQDIYMKEKNHSVCHKPLILMSLNLTLNWNKVSIYRSI